MAALPQPGQVVNGFRYNGGPPTDQRSWSKADDLAGADSRARLAMGLQQAIEGRNRMASQETDAQGHGVNPLQRDWGASMIAGIGAPKWLGGDAIHGAAQNVAKMVGGQDYQDYTQAAKSFEAAMLPVLSGANITPTEAPRQIGALLPEFGDSPETLAAKDRNRQLMLNGASHTMGQPTPYPNTGGPQQQQQQAPPPAQPAQIPVYDLNGRRIR